MLYQCMNVLKQGPRIGPSGRCHKYRILHLHHTPRQTARTAARASSLCWSAVALSQWGRAQGCTPHSPDRTTCCTLPWSSPAPIPDIFLGKTIQVIFTPLLMIAVVQGLVLPLRALDAPAVTMHCDKQCPYSECQSVSCCCSVSSS